MGNVVTDTNFIVDLETELDLAEGNTIILSSLEDFPPYTTHVPVDLEAVFEDTCQAHCYHDEVLYLTK